MTADRAPLQIIRAIPATTTEPGAVQFRTNGLTHTIASENRLHQVTPHIKLWGMAWVGSNAIDESDLRALLRAIRDAK